jgi:hypothetical protein
MTTQSLRGLANLEPYHWRGDQPNLAAFNSAFAGLLGGQEISSADMAAFTNFVNTIVYQPNPNQNLDRTLPASVRLPDLPGKSADPNTGQNLFLNVAFDNQGDTCVRCHTANPGPGTNGQVIPSSSKNTPTLQPIKIPHLRNMYQKLNASFKTGAISVNGFGYDHDGQIDGLINQIARGNFGTFSDNSADRMALEAYELCFDTGTAPATGYARTLTSANVTGSPAQTDWNTLQSQAVAGNIDLVANGTIQGQIHGLLYQPSSNNYETDTTGLGPFTQAQLTSFIQKGDTLTVMGVPPGSGARLGIDRNLDGIKNGDELAAVSPGKRSR